MLHLHMMIYRGRSNENAVNGLLVGQMVWPACGDKTILEFLKISTVSEVSIKKHYYTLYYSERNVQGIWSLKTYY